MTEKGRGGPDQFTELRKQAQARLSPSRVDTDLPDMAPEEVGKLIFDLRTHEIELDVQNEELRRAQDELVAARDRYSDLYDFAPVGYVTISHKGMIVEANLTLTRMVGVERQALLKHPFSALIFPDDEDVYYRYRREILETKQRETCRLRLLRRDAEPLWTEIDSILIEGGDNGDTLRTVISDISRQKQAEEEKLALLRQMQHAQKLESLGVLAGGIAHDFNNLLMVIMGNAELALDELSPLSPGRNSIKEIVTAGKRATDLARQMLAYSGQGKFVIEPIDLGDMVEETAHLLEVSISKKAMLRYDLADNLPTIEGDVTQIRQILMNLITNASEALVGQSGVIALSTGARHCDRAYLDDLDEVLRVSLGDPLPEGLYTYFEVADTGCGMDAQVIEKIFDPFFTTKFTGRGLGMSAVLGILRGHRGALKISSEVDKGSTFKVLFPANQPSAKAMEARSQAEVKVWQASGTVLMVDDEEPVLAVGQRMLERLGFSVLTATDGRAALDVYHQHPGEIVCVLLDLTMPRMDGEEAFRELKLSDPGVIVVLVSGFSEAEATRLFAGKGLAGFIQKPFDLNSLREKLSQALGHDPSPPNP